MATKTVKGNRITEAVYGTPAELATFGIDLTKPVVFGGWAAAAPNYRAKGMLFTLGQRFESARLMSGDRIQFLCADGSSFVTTGEIWVAQVAAKK